MGKKASIQYECTLSRKEWENVKKMRDTVHSSFSEEQQDLAVQSMMVASELIENSFKYGNSDVHFNFRVEGDRVTISIDHEVTDTGNLQNLKEHIRMIKKIDDPKKLYQERLMEIADDQKKIRDFGTHRKLGLFRIAADGGFELDCDDTGDGMVTIQARKKIK